MKQEPSILTRRGFLKSMGLIVGAAAVVPAVLVEKENKGVNFVAGRGYGKSRMAYDQLHEYETADYTASIFVNGELITGVHDAWDHRIHRFSTPTIKEVRKAVNDARISIHQGDTVFYVGEEWLRKVKKS